jgi:hypothetical protein
MSQGVSTAGAPTMGDNAGGARAKARRGPGSLPGVARSPWSSAWVRRRAPVLLQDMLRRRRKNAVALKELTLISR